MSPNSSERGIALISTLLLLSAMGLLTAAAIAAGLYLSLEVSSTGKRAREFYRVESALNRAIYLLKLDNAAYPNRKLGVFDYDNRMATPRFLADGTPRTVQTPDGGDLPLMLRDAAGGFSPEPVSTLPDRLKGFHEKRLVGKLANLDQEKRLQILLNRITDFFDADSFRDLDGMEKAEYLRAGMANLPRNAEPQFREEILWIPGAREFFPPSSDGVLNDFQLIAPAGLAALPTAVRLYSSGVDLVGDALELTDRERDELAAALDKWRTARTPLDKTLSRKLYDKVTAGDKVLLEESGFYRIEIGDDTSILRLNATLTLVRGSAAFLEFHEYFYH